METAPAPGRPPRLRKARGRSPDTREGPGRVPLASAALRPHSHLQHDFVQDDAIHQVHVNAEVVLVPAPQVPEGFHLPEEGQQRWGMAGGPSHPRQDRAAPSLPALLTQVTKGLCRKSSRSSETVTSMSPGLGRRREAAGPAH